MTLKQILDDVIEPPIRVYPGAFLRMFVTETAGPRQEWIVVHIAQGLLRVNDEITFPLHQNGRDTFTIASMWCHGASITLGRPGMLVGLTFRWPHRCAQRKSSWPHIGMFSSFLEDLRGIEWRIGLFQATSRYIHTTILLHPSSSSPHSLNAN